MNRELDLGAKDINEAIAKQIEQEELKPKPTKPLSAPVLAMQHSAIYKMHRYYARRPYNVFSKIIENYSNPGDIILDPFCGGGVTVVEGLKLRRRVIGIDINHLATWVTRVEVEPIDLEIFENLYNKWLESIQERVQELFKAKCDRCGKYGVANWFEWSNVIVCPYCNCEIILANAKKLRSGLFECTNKQCRSHIEPNKAEKKPDKMLSVSIKCQKCNTNNIRPITKNDEKIYNNIALNENSIISKERIIIPDDKFPDMDRARDDNIFGKGIKYFRDLMTPRQRIAMALIKGNLPDDRNNIAELNALYHVFSATLRYSNKFVFQSPNWQGGNPIEWAGHNYWLPFCFIELNPIDPMIKKYKAVKSGKIESMKYIGNFCKFPKTKKPWDELQDGATCWILTQSSHDIKLPDSSVDAIVTDPPFGGNVQYGELSDFYLVWLKEFLGIKGLSNKKFEAIETRNEGFSGAKDRDFYEEMLYKVFKECRRVIKREGWLVLTFHNRDIGVWMALHRAILRAGFRLPLENEEPNRGMVYQPPIENYTQTIHQRAAGSMLGDFILSFKPVETLVQLDAIKAELSVEEEKKLRNKAEEIIRYQGGADDTTLMTGLIPYLHEQGLLHRLAKYDLKYLLESNQFIFVRKEKKWFMKDMIEETGKLKVLDAIPAEVLVQNLIYEYLKRNTKATMDQLLIIIYSNLINSHRPQISTIDKVISKYCTKKKVRGQKREFYVWNPHVKTPEEVRKIMAAQLPLTFDTSASTDHNALIAIIAQLANSRGYNVHIGEAEQRKSPLLSAVSVKLSGLELGLPPEAFRFIKEIDILILRGSTILSAVEVATSISTFNKAINDRFRNLVTIVPNLNISLNALIMPKDFSQAHAELYTPANIKAGLSSKVKLFRIGQMDEKETLNKIIGPGQ